MVGVIIGQVAARIEGRNIDSLVFVRRDVHGAVSGREKDRYQDGPAPSRIGWPKGVGGWVGGGGGVHAVT